MGIGRAKKYKSGVGNWQNFSWDEPTEEKGGQEEKMSRLEKVFGRTSMPKSVPIVFLDKDSLACLNLFLF